MNSIMDPLKNWFGYTRRERRSTFILLLIIITVLGLRSVLPEKNIPVTRIPLVISEAGNDSVLISNPQEIPARREKAGNYQVKRKLLDINSGDSAALEALPGIGPVLATRIIKYRKLIGGFVSVEQLKEVYGLPVETFTLISNRIIADSLKIRKININKAEYRDLIRHPYFKKEEVAAILKFKELKGRITGINEMVENKLISEETERKISGYLEFE